MEQSKLQPHKENVAKLLSAATTNWFRVHENNTSHRSGWVVEIKNKFVVFIPVIQDIKTALDVLVLSDIYFKGTSKWERLKTKYNYGYYHTYNGIPQVNNNPHPINSVIVYSKLNKEIYSMLVTDIRKRITALETK